MDKQKIVDLAKQLEELVDQDGTMDTVVSIDVYKGAGGYVYTSANVGNFIGEGDNSIILRRHVEKIDGVEVTHRYYQTIGAEFTFVYKNGPYTVYTATKSLDKYVVTWDGGRPLNYMVDEVEDYIEKGAWVVINHE